MTAFLLFLPFGLIGWPLSRRSALAAERRWKLTRQFKDAIGSLSSFLGAGYSVENAVFAATDELVHLYGASAMITEEFALIGRQIRLNKPAELMLSDFARRSGSEEIRNFAEVFRIARKSGGELCSIIAHTTSVIGDRIAVTEEIKNLTAARRYEQKIMNLMPFAIILYIDFSSEGFFDIMYQTLAGRAVMTACLLCYAFACMLSQKILAIRF